jgi:hypothetical protein
VIHSQDLFKSLDTEGYLKYSTNRKLSGLGLPRDLGTVCLCGEDNNDPATAQHKTWCPKDGA